ncbi:dipeptidase [Paracoccus siganidrum]|uniref:Membrane dipeptidase n=1 Tax=Paracoccus siganidrum TaxID=1276757 RepID=A0A419A3S3_9RHOB|nr:dipeptidase [Paracoccus siganidrum]RJL08220.1 membrane dipeptidase [Paracoccus siganidrum]RMC35213.1 peptidase M19 [Paracoccus siganidrum]
MNEYTPSLGAGLLHDRLTVVDGLIVSDFGPEIFREMRKGGITAANCTCCIWENFTETMRNIMRWKAWFRDHSDLILQVRTTADIRRAKAEGKTGIILGWQNVSGMEDQIGYLSLFKELGVGIIQMAYNTQNLVATGCYEGHDGGLSEFGHEVVAEMNRLGILCDLSHVGSNSSRDIILASRQPVAYSHCLPAGLKAHPRNKSDEELRFIIDHGGFVGVTMFTPFLARGTDATVDDYVEAIDYVINICGEDRVGYGTDFTQGHDQRFFDWITHDKGYARRLTRFGTIRNPAGMDTIADTGGLTAAMERRGWPAARIEKVMGENWVALLREVWGA